jgi:hypothetical protein
MPVEVVLMTSELSRTVIASRADAGRSAQCGQRAVARTGTTRPSRVTTVSAIHSSRVCIAPYCGTRTFPGWVWHEAEQAHGALTSLEVSTSIPGLSHV